MNKLIYSHITFITKYLLKYFFLILVCICTYEKINAQQFNNWIFPDFNGITFNTNPISLISGGQISVTNEGYYSAASISDRNGNLLFYSDGERVWNKNNLLMPNGFGLLGGEGQINTALIIPFINDSSKYYLFVSKGLTFHNAGDEVNYNYSYNIIDMNLNGGLGDVVNKNVIIRNFATEKMVAIPNANGNDIWWVCRDWTNHFYSYKITCAGFQNYNPVISTVGNNINNNPNLLSSGEIKSSPDGKFMCISYGSYFEIYRFNAATGILNSPILFNTSPSYGIEFSPDSKQVYVTEAEFIPNIGNIYPIKQFNISNYNSSSISSSVFVVNSEFGLGGLQLGPDNKIYSNNGGEAVDVINNPNAQGVGCNFQDSVIVLPNGGYRRFPYSYVNLITAQNVQITYTVAPDCRTVTFTGKTFIKGNNLTFKWKWGEPPPVGGTAADSATQVVASQGDTTFTTITHVYPPGIDTFFASLTVTSDTVCGTGRAGIKVIVKPPKPKANFGFTATCNSLIVAFTDSSLLNTNPSITHQYAVKPALVAPSAFVNYNTSPNHTYTFSSYDSFDIRLIVSSPLACVAKDTMVKRVVLKAKPTAGFNYTNSCGSLLANITSTATIAAGSVTVQEYYVGNTLIGTGASFGYNAPSFGSYVLKHVTKSNFGCISDTATVTVNVKAKPTLSITTLRDSVCLGSSFTLTANSTVAASTIANYTWLRNGVVLPNTTNQLTDNQPTGVYTYKAVATAAQGCKNDTVTKIITVVSKPTANLTATNTCGSKAIAITSSASVINDNITSYFISYGHGNTSTTNPNNTTYTYANYGSYTLKYVVKSSVGCASDTVFVPIMVKDKPTLSITTLRDSVCLGSSFDLTANSTVAASTIANYTWLRNGIVLPNNTNTQTDNLPTGTYTYKAVATAAQGCKSDTATKIITVVSKPTATLNTVNACGSKAINITSSASVMNDNITSYFISYGDGNTSTVNPNNTTYTYANYGTYTLKYVAKSSVGCASDTVPFTIVVKDKPSMTLMYNNNACDTTNFTLTANALVNASTINNYTWLRNGTVLTNTSNQITNNLIANSYTYSVIATAANGCKTDTITQPVLVQKYPTANFTLGNGCINKNVLLTNTSTSNNSNPVLLYTWRSTGNSTIILAPLPNISFASSGVKNISLKISTSNGCADSLAKTITVDDIPTANFAITEACLGKKIEIINNSTGTIASYAWATNNGQVSSAVLPNFIFNTVGNYTIKLIIATPNNCSSDANKNVSIQAVQLTTNPKLDTNAVLNQPIQLSVTGAATYLWSTSLGNLQGANSPTPTFSASTAGIYPIKVEGTTTSGCKGTASLNVKVFAANTYLWVPNAFSPNGDGLNDKLRLTCSGLQRLTNFTLYNRYGEAVYVQNNCNATGWDGTYKGIPQPISAFVYTWSGIAFNGKVVSGQGTVMVVR